MSEASVSAMRGDDAEVLANLWVAAWKSVPVAVDFDARRGWIIARLETLARDGVLILVARDAMGALAGFVTIDRATGALDQLCVAPTHFGDGTARQLLNQAKRAAPGRVALDVNADNRRARAFYRREGFVETGRAVNQISGLATVSMLWTASSERSLAPTPRTR